MLNEGDRIYSGLPADLRQMLGNVPNRGENLNLWIFGASRRLHPHCKPEEVLDLLRKATAGRPIKPGEIERAVRRSAPGFIEFLNETGGAARPAWPRVNDSLRAQLTNEGYLLRDVIDASPTDCSDGELDPEAVLDHLYPDSPLLCCGWSLSECVTGKREDWRGQMHEMQFIVPNPMIAETGLTQEGTESPRSLNNTGPRRYLIIEQDQGSKDEQAGVLVHLSTLGPMVMIVDSGNKSIHGWFACGKRDEAELLKFMQYAVSLGADRATWTRCQFVRMPGGVRQNGQRQNVLFFNPEVLEGNI